MNKEEMISANTTIDELINHPIIGKYAERILPWDHERYDGTMRLSDMASLMPYHTHIIPEICIEPLNEMIEQGHKNNQFFYDIYTEKEKAIDPTLRYTGLFYFKGKPDAPFAVINAGGGFSYAGCLHESIPHALYISRQGYHAFALRYRTGSSRYAMRDLARALVFIFEHKDEFGLSTDCYSLWGGSAGARMAAAMGSYGTEAFGEKSVPRAGTVIMQYTGYTDCTREDPPTYACVGREDRIAYWKTMKDRIEDLDQMGIDTQFHVYPNLGHGFGLGIGTSAEGWIDNAIGFWYRQINKRREE